jgi:hypothetical protein
MSDSRIQMTVTVEDSASDTLAELCRLIAAMEHARITYGRVPPSLASAVADEETR